MSEPTKTYEQACREACEWCARSTHFSDGRCSSCAGFSFVHHHATGQMNPPRCKAPTREAYEQSLRDRLDASEIVKESTQRTLALVAAERDRLQSELRAANERAERLERELEVWKKLSAQAHRELHALKIGLAAAEQRENTLKLRVKRLEECLYSIRGTAQPYEGLSPDQYLDMLVQIKWGADLALAQPEPTPKCPKCHDTGSIPNGTDEMACDCLGKVEPIVPTKPAEPGETKEDWAGYVGAGTDCRDESSTANERERCVRICEEYAAEMQSARSGFGYLQSFHREGAARELGRRIRGGEGTRTDGDRSSAGGARGR